MRIAFMVEVKVRLALYSSTNDTKQYFSIQQAHVTSAYDDKDSIAFERAVKKACDEAVAKEMERHENQTRLEYYPSVLHFQFIP